MRGDCCELKTDILVVPQSKAPNRRWRRWTQIFTDEHPNKDISPICVYLRNLRSTSSEATN